MRKVALAALLLSACATAPPVEEDNFVPPAQLVAPADPRLGELQTAMTELLERLDVLNDRIARLESGANAAAAQQTVSVAPTRVATPPSRVTPAPSAANVPSTVVPDPAPVTDRALIGAQIAQNYRDAIVLFGKGRRDESRLAFQNVFETDPTGDLADNALFWIGETYFSSGNYGEATRYYRRVIDEYPTENKAPDALYKIAMTHEKRGDLALAKRALQEVIERYPYSTPADTAKRELERLKY